MKWLPVFFDSLGAKCSCVLVETRDANILIDPGAAELQPGYPLPPETKQQRLCEARRAIGAAAKKAHVVVLTHYHYDHHTKFGTRWLNARELYLGKRVLAKNPNQYINRSQRARAELVWHELCAQFGYTLDEFLEGPLPRQFEDLVESLELSREKDFGDYSERREQLLARGARAFRKLCGFWNAKPLIKELRFENTSVEWADGRTVELGATKLRFSEPRYHGIEYDQIGWVFSVIIECGGKKLLHSSDLQGPMVEDYAEALIRENPDVLVLDGPPTYLLGFMLNRINLRRAVDNICRILDNIDAETVLWDHHLPRDVRYRARVAHAYEHAQKIGKRLVTVAEFLGGQAASATSNAELYEI
jgi:hypothetical protein